MTWEHYRDTNRALWDERVSIHVGSDFYGVERVMVMRVDILGRVPGVTALVTYGLIRIVISSRRIIVRVGCLIYLLGWASHYRGGRD